VSRLRKDREACLEPRQHLRDFVFKEDTLEKAKKRRDSKTKVAKRVLHVLHGREKSRLERLLGGVVLMRDSGQFKKELKLFYMYVAALHVEKRL
jgi:hypothetical protein